LAVSRIFVSHSSANTAEAIAIRDWMIAHGWDDLFVDFDPERGLRAGERWQEALKEAAYRCEMVVFLISPVWAASKWCLAEFLLAKSLNKRVFAVIVEPTQFSELPTEITAEWHHGSHDGRARLPCRGDSTRRQDGRSCILHRRAEPVTHWASSVRPRPQVLSLAP
jgi:hypothetical protein